MSSKKYLSQAVVDGQAVDLWTKASLVEVTVDGTPTNLAAVLTTIFGDIDALPTTSEVGAQIATAISESGHASFEKAETVPAPEAAKENVLYLVKNAETGHYDIYAKVAGDTEGSYTMELLDDTTVDLSGKLDKIVNPTAGDLVTANADGSVGDSGKKVGGATLSATPDANTVATEAAVKAGLDEKAGKDTATQSAAGLMAPADKQKLDGLAGVVILAEAAEVPAGTPNGTLIIRDVTSA